MTKDEEEEWQDVAGVLAGGDAEGRACAYGWLHTLFASITL
jgi:carbohydrate-selective porin OprB